MKLGDIVQRIQSLYSSGVESYDSRLTPLHIYSKILSARAAYLTSQQVTDYTPLIQETCIRLHTVSACCNLPKNITVVQGDIPDMIFLSGVYTLDNKSLVEIPQEQVEYVVNGLTSKPMYYRANGKIILLGNQTIRYIKVTGVPYDVVEFYQYCRQTVGLCNNACSKCLSAYDIDMPVTDSMVEYIVQSAANELIRMFSMVREDKQQDASDDQSIVVPQQNSENR